MPVLSQGELWITLGLTSIPAGHLFLEGFFRFARYREGILERVSGESHEVTSGSGE
jgi:hypothetical protein